MAPWPSPIALLSNIWTQLKRSHFVRNVATLATGTALAQAITMAFAPLVTRIYGPEAFGLHGTFVAVASVAIPLAALAYPIAVVLPRSDSDAIGLIRLSAAISFIIFIITSLLFWSCENWITASLGIEAVTGFMLLIPITMLFSSWSQIAEQWLIRKKAFKSIARAGIANALISNVAKTGLGWLHPVGAMLIILTTLGYALYTALLVVSARKQHAVLDHAPTEPHALTASTRTHLLSLAYQHRDFPMYRAPQNFINAASQSLPVLMLATLFGPAAAGFYALGKMTMGIPSILIGKAVADAFYPRITEAAHNRENLAQHILRATGILTAIGVAPFGLIALFGPWLFEVVFGPEWAMAGHYARWLALFFFFNFINKPCVSAVPVLGLQRGLLIYEIFSTGSKALGLMIGFYWLNSDIWAVAIFSISGIIAYGAMISWILLHAAQRKKNGKTSQ